MKPHLPTVLRRSLLAAMVTVSLTCPNAAKAAIMHPDVSLLTYTDFGQNLGRYATGPVNSLLTYIREQEGGVTISYSGGQPAYTMLHGMIDFSSQCDGGYGASIGYNWYATVRHNGVHNNTYAGNFIGTANAIHYVGIEYRGSENNTFLHTPSNDYKITRQSKLITDVTGSTVYGSANGDYSGIEEKTLAGQLLYRSGSGRMELASHDGSLSSLTSAYAYIIGGITTIGSVTSYNEADSAFSVWTYFDPRSNGVSDSSPLPYACRTGDSGSPTWVWNESTNQYEYLNAAQSIANTNTQYRGAAEWTADTMESYNKYVSLSDGVDEVHIGVVNREGETLNDATNKVSATQYWGSVTDASGKQLQEFRGVLSGINTWNDLSSLLDKNESWYAYGAGYLNATASGDGADLSYADLFHTDNLVFVAGDAQEKHVIVDADIDLGIGYVQFSKADEVKEASFHLSSAAGKEDGSDYLLNSAGYAVDAGVSLYMELTGAQEWEDAYLREWRKIGDGDMYIEGSGDNYILLNLGGNGATYLQREAETEGGTAYSAYNVLANNGTTVVIKDIGQIKNDFTFGFRGGVLDMSGNSMVWNNDDTADTAGFTIHALDEHAIISNSKGDTVLRWTQGGAQEWLGSFTDTEGGSLQFIYDGGAGSTLTLHSIHTDLSHHAAEGSSSIEVASGTLQLVGTNTIHGMGSVSGTNSSRYSNAHDWHYADMSAPVTIKNGATFELSHHARLTGNVTIGEGGLFLMREGVQQQYEYVEGGYTLEDTYQYRDFYGLKGNITNNGTFRVEYSEGTTSTNTYSGQITGSGAVEICLGLQGMLILENKEGEASSYSGAKKLESGILLARQNSALGATASAGSGKWLIGAMGILASEGFTGSMSSSSILNYIDSSSTGVLALTENRTEAIDTSQHTHLYIGALAGQSIHYGSEGASLTANTYQENGKPATSTAEGYWRLGGGGGELIVDFRLEGNNDLILGNDYGKGTVTLTNTGNTFSGQIYFNGAITLNYTDAAALGHARIQLGYATRIPAITSFDNLELGAKGVLLLKAGDNANPATIDLTSQTAINLGSDDEVTYSGGIILAEDAAYHFGGGSGTLTVAGKLESGHGLIIDGQTYSGGTVILKDLQTLNNGSSSITIMGYSEEDATVKEGNATLKLEEGQQFNTNQQITLKDGGILDLTGTSQTFAHLSMAEGSLLTDSSEGTSSSIILTTSDTLTLLGDMDISAITKEGTGTVELGGSNQYQSFTASSGTVKLMTDTALASGEATFRQGSTLEFNGHVAGGTLLLDNAEANASAGGGVAAGGLLLATENGGTINTAAGQRFTVSGSIGAVAGSTLKLAGPGTYALYGSSINEQGGTLELVESSMLYIGTGTQSIGGALSVKAGSTITNTGTASTNSFDTLSIDGNSGTGEVLLTTTEISSWSSSSWTINHLNGKGTFTWDPRNRHWSTVSSTLQFTGEGNFDGTVKLHGGGSSADWLTTNRYVLLSHDEALQNASLELRGQTKQIALAINTGNARLKGVNGSKSLIYAGDTTSGISTASATLTLTAAQGESYTFSGNVGANDTNTAYGVSLSMEGKGTQTFNGETVIVNDLSVAQGSLAFGETTALTIRGNIALTQGGSLTIGSSTGFSLNEGRSISILSMEDSTATAAFHTPILTLNGGSLSFSAELVRHFATNTGTAALTGITAVQLGSEAGNSLSIHLSDTNLLGIGSYTLASGNWSEAGNLEFTTIGLDYMDAEYSATESGLILTIKAKENNYIWNGTENAASWNATTYGQTSISLTETCTAVFNDVAENKKVSLEAPAHVAKLLFDNNQDYILTGAEGASLTTGNITQSGTGQTTIHAALNAGTILVEQGSLILGQAAAIHSGIDIRNNGTLSLSGLSGNNSLSLRLGKNATLSFTGDTPGNLTLDSLTLEEGGTITFSNAHIATNAGKSHNFQSDSVICLADGSVLDDRQSTYRLTDAGLTIEGNGTLYVSGFRLSNNSSSAPSSLTVAKDATLVVTGEALGQDGSFALSHWQTDGNSLRVAGTLTSNAALSAWDSSADITVLGGGALNLLKGLVRNVDRSHTISLTVEKGGALYAAGGENNDNLTINLQAGSTMGAIGHEATFSNNMLLGTQQEAGTVTLQTNYSSVAEDGSFAVTQGSEGGAITLTGNISSYIGATLALAGNGTVESQGSLAVGAGLQVLDSATLHVTGGLSVLGDVSVADGATLHLQGATLASNLTLASGSLSISGDITMGAATSISNSGSISLAEDAAFHLSVEDITDASYTIISGGSITYNGDATPTFFINGLDATSLTDIMTVTRTGNELSFTLQGAGQYLTWNGSEAAGTIWAIGNESLNWQTQGGDAAAYKSLAHVTFAEGGEHSVTVSGEVVAQQMNITAGAGETAWKFDSSGEADGAIEVWTDMSISRAAEASFGVDVAIGGGLTVEGNASFARALSVGSTIDVTGELALTAAAATNDNFSYNLDASQGGTLSLDTQGKTLSYNSGILKADTFLLTGGGSLNTNLEGLALDNVGIGENTTLTITHKYTHSPTGKTLGQVTLENGAKLAFYNPANAQNLSISSIVLQGDNATVTDGHYAGLYTIGSLSGSGNLCLAKGSDTPSATIYDIGTVPLEGDSFTGTLTVNNAAASAYGTERPISLIISNGTITQNATISLTATQAAGATQIGLGLHDTTVRIAGLASQQNLGNRAAVYSGTASSDFKINNGTVSGISDAGTSRTLAINTTKGASHIYYGQIGSNVNLNISGEGTQTFAGASAAFDGSITLNSGTLAFANAEAAAMLATTGGVNLNGGTLDLSGLKLTAGNTEAAISLKEGSSLTFGSGLRLNMGALGYGTYQLFDSGQESSLINWGGLTENNIILDGQYSPKTSVTFDAKAGTLTIRAIELVWNGGSSNNTWVASGDNWLAGQNSADFETGDVVRFADGDNLSKEVVVADGGVNALDVTVEGTGFQFTGGELNVQDTLTIEQEASATFGNVTHVANHLDVAGTAQFNNTLLVDGAVTVTGKLELTAAAATNGCFAYSLDASQGGTLSLDTQEAALTYNAGSLKADTFLLTGGGSLNTDLEGLTLNNVGIGENTTLTITHKNASSPTGKTLGKVTLENGAKLAFTNPSNAQNLSIGSIVLQGDNATVTDGNYADLYTIGSLAGKGTLTLAKASSVTSATVYYLGEADTPEGDPFTGTLTLNNAATGSYSRPVSLVISNDNITQNATISLTATQAATLAQLGLGLHADTVKITGLESQQNLGNRAAVYSGTASRSFNINNGTVSGISDTDTRRALSINTTKGASHTYYGQIGSNVNLNISGEGTQTFAGTSAAFDGSITLESGTLAFANAEAAAMLATTGGVNLNGGTLDLSALTLTAGSTSAAIALGENSFLTFGENIKLNLGALEDGTYTLFSGGNLEDWEKLTMANLVLSGHGQATFHQGGSVTLSGLEHYTLVWDASKPSGTWESSSANWKHGESSSNFANGDSVTFASTAAVAVVGDVQADKVTVEAGADLTLTREEAATLSMNTLHIEGTLKTAFGLSVGAVSSTEGSEWQLLAGAEQDLAKSQLDGVRHLHVAEGATLAVSDETMNGFALGENTRLTGDGTVALHLSAAYANTVHTGSEFKGTTYVQAGNMTLDGSAVGSALKLAVGSHAQLSSSSTEATAFGQNLILEGTSEINQNGRDLTMSGEVSGVGTYKHTGGGNLTFKGNVDLGGFSVDNTVASATTFAGDSTTVGDVSLIPSEGSSEQATVDFAGARTIISGTLSIGAGENQVSLAGTIIKAGSDSAATISGATTTALTEQGQTKLTIQGKDQGNISNAIMELAEGSSLELADVRITGNSLLSADTLATLTVHRATIVLPESTTGEASTTYSSMELTLTGSGETATVAEGTTVYTLTSSALQKMSLSGTRLSFDLSNLDLSGYDLLCISLEGPGSVLTGLDGLTVSATRGMGRSAGLMTGYYETGVTSSPVIYFDLSGAAVPTPEPTTTTLGLLALSALAARRRRKAR